MAVIADLFAIFEQTWVENILRFKHRVSRSLSRAFETWQGLELVTRRH